MNVALKVLVFSVVSVATWMVTSTIVAQQQKRVGRQTTVAPLKLEATNVDPGSISQANVTLVKPGAVRNQVELGRSGGFAEAYLRSRNISVEDNVATVTAHVSLADKRPGMSYVWRVRVVDRLETPLAGMVYLDQMFTVEANGQKEVDFRDVVNVPLDAKRIELALYAKGPNEDLSFLEDSDKSMAHQLVRTVKLLTP